MWFHVRLADGKTGWIFGSLTEPYRERDAATIQRRIIQARLAIENLNFADGVDLFEFVIRVSPPENSPDTATFDLFKLLALDHSVRSIMSYEPRDPAQRDWLRRHEDDLAYSEPAGQWMVRAELYWNLEAKHRGTPLAEQIAWTAANAGIPGECEGYIPCTLAILEITDGRYLQLYPAGAHTAEAMEHIDYPLQEILKPNTPYTTDPRESVQLHESVAKLSEIIERTSSPRKADILARLKRIDQTYR